MQQIPASGVPAYDNVLRTWQRRIVRDTKHRMKITTTRSGGRIPRKRKKYLTTTERANLNNLVLHLTFHNALQHNVNTHGTQCIVTQAAKYALPFFLQDDAA